MKEFLGNIQLEDVLTLLITLIKPQEVYNNCIFNEGTQAKPADEPADEPKIQRDEKQSYKDMKSNNESPNILISYEEMVTLISNKTGVQTEWVERIIKELNSFHNTKNNDEIV